MHVTEEDWAAIQRRAIEEAEAAQVSLPEFLSGLQTMQIELADRIRQVEEEVEQQEPDSDD